MKDDHLRELEKEFKITMAIFKVNKSLEKIRRYEQWLQNQV